MCILPKNKINFFAAIIYTVIKLKPADMHNNLKLLFLTWKSMSNPMWYICKNPMYSLSIGYVQLY